VRISHELKLINFIIIGIGIINEISTSKIRKITAIIKNCMEKGDREDDLGSNPHSKGEFFSRLRKFFFLIFELIIIKAIGMINEIKIIKSIILSLKGLINWKLNILIILKE